MLRANPDGEICAGISRERSEAVRAGDRQSLVAENALKRVAVVLDSGRRFGDACAAFGTAVTEEDGRLVCAWR